jgi:hypothetical protein
MRVNQEAPKKISAADLGKLPRYIMTMINHDKQVQYEGVLLRDVMALGGVDLSHGLQGKQLATYVSATGTDGYQVVFGLAELDPSLTDSDLLIADMRAGQPLDAQEGPLRIVAPHDKRPARSLRMLTEIDVVQLKK